MYLSLFNMGHYSTPMHLQTAFMDNYSIFNDQW